MSPIEIGRRNERLDAMARDRFAASNRALQLASLVGAVALAVFLALAIPTYGWIPFLVLGVPAAAGPLTHLRGDAVTERAYAISLVVWVVVLGGCAASTGGADSFLLPLMASMTLALFSRLPPASAMRYAWLAFGLACVPVLVTDWSGFVRFPWLLGSCAVGLLSMSFVARQMAAGELHHRGQATIDQLTGLLNRRGLEDRISELIDQAAVIGDATPLALIGGDLDHFKLINDAYGHARGDDVLRDVAYIMRKQLRRFELAYRLGGEEFLIVLPGHDAATATALAQKIRAAVEADRPGGVEVTISMGVAVAKAANMNVKQLLLAADLAVYAAKNAGRNRVATAPAEAPPAD